MPTPVREAHDNRPRADAGCRRPSEVSCASSAGVLSPRDHLFSVFLWSAWERASNRSGGSQPQPPATRMLDGSARRSRAACGSAPPAAGGDGRWERPAARRLVLRALRATAPAELQELLRDPPAAAALAGHAAAGARRQRPAAACSPGSRCGRHDRREDAVCVNAWADACAAIPVPHARNGELSRRAAVKTTAAVRAWRFSQAKAEAALCYDGAIITTLYAMAQKGTAYLL